jgi:hypothetical protein
MSEQPEIPLPTLVDLQRRMTAVEHAQGEIKESQADLIALVKKLSEMTGVLPPEEGDRGDV